MPKNIKNINLKILESTKETVAKKLDIPDEIIYNIPLITILGRSKINIENFKNIKEYSNNEIKLKTSCGILKIEGTNLVLKTLSKDKISVNGNLLKFEFML